MLEVAGKKGDVARTCEPKVVNAEVGLCGTMGMGMGEGAFRAMPGRDDGSMALRGGGWSVGVDESLAWASSVAVVLEPGSSKGSCAASRWCEPGSTSRGSCRGGSEELELLTASH